MMKFLLSVICLTLVANVFSQDIIYTSDNDSILCEISEIGTKEVKYKKFNNLNGPTYLIDKNEVGKIVFKNGEEEFFDFQKEYVFEENPELNQYKYLGKLSKKIVWDYRFDISKVRNAKKVYYSGLDLSNLELINPAKVGQEEELGFYFPKWINRFDAEIPPTKYISRWLKIDNFEVRSSEVQSRYKLNKKDWIKFENDSSIPIEQVLSIVKEYSKISGEDNSVAFSSIIESFDKSQETVTVIFVFYDPNSREVLWATKAEGKADGMGFATHWSLGIVDSLKNYVDLLYKKALK